MKMYKGKHYWVNGFENEFEIIGTEKSLKAEIKSSNDLLSVYRTVIMNEKGEVIYDEQKETPYATTQEKNGTGTRTKKKKAVRKKDGISAESKRRVCLPQKA
jgi:hypothetical protein